MTGRFIVFEGIDGAGKTTQFNLLKEYLQQQGVKVFAAREPGGTPVGEELRKILLNPQYGDLHYRTEALLYAAARAQLVYSKIIPALNEGKVVLCDRFVDSTIAYQGYGRGLSERFLEQINDLATGGLKPDLVLVFDLTVEQSLKRVNKRKNNDRLESEAQTFYRQVRKGYLEICRKYPENHLLLDASLTISELHQLVKEAVEGLLNGGK